MIRTPQHSTAIARCLSGLDQSLSWREEGNVDWGNPLDLYAILRISQERKSSEFKRWLTSQGATVKLGGKGSHLKIELNGKTSVLPMHSKELKKGTVEEIKKQLGLK